MKKIEPLPFHTLYKKNDNMYQNVVIVSERAKNIVSENVIDLTNKEEGFESTEEILESESKDFNKTKWSSLSFKHGTISKFSPPDSKKLSFP